MIILPPKVAIFFDYTNLASLFLYAGPRFFHLTMCGTILANGRNLIWSRCMFPPSVWHLPREVSHL